MIFHLKTGRRGMGFQPILNDPSIERFTSPALLTNQMMNMHVSLLAEGELERVVLSHKSDSKIKRIQVGK